MNSFANDSTGWTRIARKVAFTALVGLASFSSACADPADLPDEGESVAGESSQPLTFSATANATTASWKTFEFTAKVGDKISATLDWENAAANLNVYLYDPTGKVVAYANTATAKPERASTTAAIAGTWKVAMKCGSGSTKYSIDLQVTPAAPVSRFPGDPGQGKLYMGAAVVSQSPNALDPLEAELGGKKFGLSRLYYADAISWSNVDGHIAKGHLPAVSFKPGTKSIAAIANGGEDAWIDSIGAEIKKRAPTPFFMTFFHEPEDNFPAAADAATFRAAYRRIIGRWRSAGVKNFTNVSNYYMTDWTFSAASGRDWRWWYPDWKGTTAAGSSKDAPNAADFYSGADSVVDVVGFDIYNWWEPGMPVAKWKSFQAHADTGVSRTKLLGKPYCVGEWGTMAYQSGGVYDAARTKAWLTDAYTYMVQNNFVCAAYWNNDHSPDNLWDPRMETSDPQKLRFAAMKDLLGRASTVAPKL